MSLIIFLVILGLVAWLLTFVPLPAPFGKIIQVILIIVAVVIVINFLMGMTEYGPFLKLR